MNYLTLFNHEHGFVATRQKVFSADELTSLQSVTGLVQELGERIAEQKTLSEQARERGFDEGWQQGAQQAREEAESHLLARLHQLDEQLEAEKERIRAACAILAVDMVRRIAGNIDTDRWLLAQAEQAAEQLLDHGELVLRVHPDHADAVNARLQASEATRITRVQADEGLSLQGCTLDSPVGQVKVDLDTQLDSLLNHISAGDEPHG